MGVIKWALLAVGAYLVWRHFNPAEEEYVEGGATLPADDGMYAGEGGGGGGGGSGGGDYQTPAEATTPPPAPVRDRSGIYMGVLGAIARTPRNPGSVKPAAPRIPVPRRSLPTTTPANKRGFVR